MTTTFKRLYQLGENVTVDESLVGFRGRVRFKIYMPKKQAKFGIKGILSRFLIVLYPQSLVWSLVDNETYYCHNAIIYTGKPDGHTETNLGKNVLTFFCAQILKTLGGSGAR